MWDLDDVNEGGGAVGPCEILQGNGVVVPFTLELFFDPGQEALNGDGGAGGGDTLCERGQFPSINKVKGRRRLTWPDERGTESNSSVALERDVGDSVREGNAILYRE